MGNTQSLSKTIRGKKLGLLIRNARQVYQKTPEQCAQAMGISKEGFQAYESGIASPSLPEVELLAYFFQIPLEHFLDQSQLLAPENGNKDFSPQKLMNLRQRMVGIQIRKTRLDAEISLEELSEKAGISAEQISAFESGKKPIPLPDLEVLAAVLATSVRDFQDANGPVGGWFQQERTTRGFRELPTDVQNFVAKPVNQPYLVLAQRLSEMDVEKLRTVAEGLLEITL